ncbi:fimbrial protein [Moellerella wisconsensis]|uniref:Minor fimbrial subunit n=1 Tax=Moellerella wisconsensis ATCC 35017 TaxID=1354267 RepID=A0A0N0Z9X4_9GAMM|nr:fimbrial protein [Moellerella wisconsensis]KPD02935.1 minor fimbrial subunit [Moellerella wisconsensis ATCC 35017]VFS53741.1 Fimbria A protein precursor [Moellerella wisconsensis]
MKIAPHHIFMFLTFLYISVLSNTAIAESLGILQTRIEVKGVLIGNTCDIENNDIKVEMGRYTNKDLQFHDRMPSVPFEIKIKNCGVDFENDAKITFTGNESTDFDLQGFLALDASSSASGFAIGFEDNTGHFLPLYQQSKVYPLKGDNGVMQFKAFLKADKKLNKVVSGEFFATANFLIEYE